jgi:hypothetical protein
MKIYSACVDDGSPTSMPGPFFRLRSHAEEYARDMGYGDIEEFDLFDTPIEAYRAELECSMKWETRVYGGDFPECVKGYHAKLKQLANK